MEITILWGGKSFKYPNEKQMHAKHVKPAGHEFDMFGHGKTQWNFVWRIASDD